MKISDILYVEKLKIRFWGRVKKSGHHLIWQGPPGTDGHGKVGFVTKEGRYRSTHAARIAFLLIHGEVNDELKVCHTCDIPLCCIGWHLFEGTQTQNLEDMTRKGRRRYIAHSGIDNGRALFTQEEVEELRMMFTCGMTTAELAKMKSVHWNTMNNIVKCRSYK